MNELRSLVRALKNTAARLSEMTAIAALAQASRLFADALGRQSPLYGSLAFRCAQLFLGKTTPALNDEVMFCSLS